ncbi:MAG: hypothetical protein QM723_21145 [Myxococcaceae bacterium]
MIDCPHLPESLSDPLSPAAQAHLDGCQVCQRARSAFKRAEDSVPPPPQLEKLSQLVKSELQAHPKVWPWWVEALGVVAVNALFAGVMLFSMSWNTVQHDSPALRWAVVVDLVVLVLGGALVALAPAARAARWVTVALAAFAMVGTLWGASGHEAVPFAKSYGCAFVELGASALPLAVAVWMATRMAKDVSRVVAYAFAAGGAALVALHLHCPNGTVEHLTAFHLVPWVLLVGIAQLARSLAPTKAYAP